MSVFNAATVALAAQLLTFQGSASRPAKPLPSTALTRIETVVEGEFRQWERTSAVRLRDVTVKPQTGGALMTVLLTVPRRQQFEPNAEIAFERIWNALGRQPNAYRELGRIAVSLKRDSREMTVTCTARRVEASKGRSEFANLKRTCHVN